jgi:hypothetical protein
MEEIVHLLHEGIRNCDESVVLLVTLLAKFEQWSVVTPPHPPLLPLPLLF